MSVRVAAAALAAGLALGACGGARGGAAAPGHAEPASEASASEDDLACSADGDCVVSTFDTCCACPQCPGDPHALSVDGARRELERARCETVDCRDEDAICSVAGMCPPGPPVRAVCDAGRCALRPE